MKNPMSTTEMKQAIDDIVDGYDMQVRVLGDDNWMDRVPMFVGEPPNFLSHEYRRKPEPFTAFCNVYDNGNIATHKNLSSAKLSAEGNKRFVKRIRVVEDPDWTEHEPEEKNPWRPIVKGQWPECKPDDLIIIKYEDGSTAVYDAGKVVWKRLDSIEWKFAEDE